MEKLYFYTLVDSYNNSVYKTFATNKNANRIFKKVVDEWNKRYEFDEQQQEFESNMEDYEDITIKIYEECARKQISIQQVKIDKFYEI